MLVCSKCGGKNIQKLAWIDANTNKKADTYHLEGMDRWCDDCDCFVEFDIVEDNKDEEFYDEIFG